MTDERVTIKMDIDRDLLNRLSTILKDKLDLPEEDCSDAEALYHLLVIGAGHIAPHEQEELMDDLNAEELDKMVKVITFESNICTVCSGQAQVDKWMQTYKDDMDFMEEDMKEFRVYDYEVF